MESGQVDMYFTAMSMQQTDLSHVEVLSEDIYLTVPNSHRLAERSSIRLSELEAEPFIGYSKDYIFQRMNDHYFREAGITPKYVCRVDEPPAVASLVRAGLGVALYECRTAQDDKLKLIPIEEPKCKRDYHLLARQAILVARCPLVSRLCDRVLCR